MEIRGYKALYADRTDRRGVLYEEGEDYHVDTELGKDGMLMCVHLSDVFLGFNPNNVTVAEVIASGDLLELSNHGGQESYTELYLASDIHVERFLSREEIMEIMKTASPSDVSKFFSTYNPTEEEAFEILRACNSKDYDNRAKKAYLYFIKGLNVYELDYADSKNVLKKVFDNGQDSNQRGKGK